MSSVSPICGIGRLKQIEGTCWLNTSLNMLLLSLNMYSDLIDLFDSKGFTEEEKKEFDMITTGHSCPLIGKSLLNEDIIKKYIYAYIYQAKILNESLTLHAIRHPSTINIAHRIRSTFYGIDTQKHGYYEDVTVLYILHLLFSNETEDIFYTYKKDIIVPRLPPKIAESIRGVPELKDELLSKVISFMSTTDTEFLQHLNKLLMQQLHSRIAINKFIFIRNHSYILVIGNANFIETIKTENPINNYYYLESAAITFPFFGHGNHVVTYFRCSNKYYIYDSNKDDIYEIDSILVNYDKWIEEFKTLMYRKYPNYIGDISDDIHIDVCIYRKKDLKQVEFSSSLPIKSIKRTSHRTIKEYLIPITHSDIEKLLRSIETLLDEIGKIDTIDNKLFNTLIYSCKRNDSHIIAGDDMYNSLVKVYNKEVFEIRDGYTLDTVMTELKNISRNLQDVKLCIRNIIKIMETPVELTIDYEVINNLKKIVGDEKVYTVKIDNLPNLVTYIDTVINHINILINKHT